MSLVLKILDGGRLLSLKLVFNLTRVRIVKLFTRLIITILAFLCIVCLQIICGVHERLLGQKINKNVESERQSICRSVCCKRCSQVTIQSNQSAYFQDPSIQQATKTHAPTEEYNPFANQLTAAATNPVCCF